jgi:Na+/proline symporter
MTGFAVIAAYALFIFAITSWYSKGYNKDKEAFLVANRKIGWLQGSMGAGAAWIQAPGLFVAAQQAYTNGLTGLFYFSLGNFFTLMIFAFGVNYFRNKYPDGYTLSQFLGTRLGKIVQFIIVAQITVGVIQQVTFSLFAGSKSVEFLTGLSPLITSIFLVGIALVYTLRGGIKATFITDMVKIGVIWIGMAIIQSRFSEPLVSSRCGQDWEASRVMVPLSGATASRWVCSWALVCQPWLVISWDHGLIMRSMRML